jgi:poly(3-hydroxybutyrate) depolymerase
MIKRTVIPGPQFEVAATDNIVEQEANENPRHEVDRCCGWHPSHREEKQGEIQISQESDPEALVQYPLDDWEHRTKQEEKDETIVKLSVREEMLRANYSPLQGSY